MLMTRESSPDVLKTRADLVIFRLNRVHYAIAIEPIQQIIEMVTITPILKTEAWMEGVINYHGMSIPVINLRRHFGLEVVPYRWHTPIILVNVLGRMVGLIVDEVLDVLAISAEQFIDPRMILPSGMPETPLLKSIIQSATNVTLLLDLSHLFDQAQVHALSAATSVINDENVTQAAARSTRKAAARKKSPKSSEKPAGGSSAADETYVEEEKS